MSNVPQQPTPGFVRKYETHITLAISLLALVVAIVVGIRTVSISEQQRRIMGRANELTTQANELSEQQTALSGEQTALATEQTSLSKRMAAQGSSSNLMTVLDMVSTAKADLGGWAIRDAGQGDLDAVARVPSDEAVKGYLRERTRLGTDDSGSEIIVIPFSDPKMGQVNRFELRQVPITSLKSIVDVLSRDRSYQKTNGTSQDDIDLVLDYIAPIIYPKCQADDPAVAASALVACSLLVKSKDNRLTGDVREVLTDGNFTKVRFNWPNLDLSYFNFAGAQFAGVTTTVGTALDVTHADVVGASFYGAVLNNVTFTAADASKLPIEANDDKDGVVESVLKMQKPDELLAWHNNQHFANLACADFSSVEFNGCTITSDKETRPEFQGCKFDKAVFSDCVIDNVVMCGGWFRSATAKPGQKFTRADLRAAYFGDATLNGTTFSDSCLLSYADFSNAQMENVNFKASDLGNARFPGSKMALCKFNDCSLDEAAVGTTKAPSVLSSAHFVGGSAVRARFNCSMPQPATFEGVDLTGANFGWMVPEEFNGIVFSNARMDWAIVPYSDKLEADINSQAIENLVPGKVGLSDTSLMIVVQPAEGRMQYMGAISFKEKVDEKFGWEPKADRGAKLIDYLRLEDNDVSILGIDKKRLGKKSEDVAANQEAYDAARAYLGEVWELDFPTPAPPPSDPE